jgi:transposase
VLRYEIPRIDRFPSGQEFASYCRLGKCRQEAGGKHVGTSGKKSGNAPRQGACSEAAALCLRHHAAGHTYLAR